MSAFTRKWLTGLAALALVAGLCAWGMARHEAVLAERVRGGDLLAPPPDLGLSAEQAHDIALLEKAYRASLADLCDKHCAAKARIARLFAENRPDELQLLDGAREAGEAYRALEIATVRHLLSVGARLTPDQRGRYYASIAGGLGVPCERSGSMKDCPQPVSP
ncbi:MAG: periplasmic heavy metal sensor [Verrucomicrobiae bacterium]|nr:periplasmic heavy metal sensor [Verrucomicrobiae bacterium]